MGWTAADTLATPIPQIELAFSGYLDRIAKRPPYAVPPSPQTVAQGLAGALRGMTAGNPARRRKK